MEQRKVQRVTRSPMNKSRWCLKLDCGHEVWVTAGRKPTRATADCEKCIPAPRTGPLRVKFMDADFRREPKTSSWCCMCQNDLNPEKPYRHVRLVHGGMFILHPEDEARYTPGCELLFEDGAVERCQGDMGGFKIGPECIRKIGLEWSHP